MIFLVFPTAILMRCQISMSSSAKDGDWAYCEDHLYITSDYLYYTACPCTIMVVE